MDGVDTSVISKAIPTPTNPLDTLAKAQGVQQGVLQNRLLGQQVEGKISMGKAAADAVDPVTGKFDGDKFLKTLAADPKGAFQVPEAAAQAVARNLQEKQLGAADLDLTSKRWAKVGEAATTFLSQQKGPDGKPIPLTKAGVTQGMSDMLIGSGMFNSPEAVQQIAGFVRTLPEDDAGIRARLGQLFLQSHATTEGVALLSGAPTTIDSGGQVNIMRTSPLTGQTQPLAAIPKTLGPGEAIKPAYQRYNPATRQMETVLAGDALAAMQPGTGGNTAPPGIAAGPPLGQGAAADAAGNASVLQLTKLQDAAEKAPVNKASLLNIRDQVNNFGTGPKADWTYALKALATQMGLASPQVRDQVAAQEEFNKLATQFINAQVSTLGGGGTDSKLESAMHGSPNEFMSKEGIKNVTALMIGLEDAVSAKNNAWQKWSAAGNGPESYPKFVAGFNAHYNPRVFQAVYMDGKQRATMLGNMDEGQREQFQRDRAFAKRAGWIQ